MTQSAGISNRLTQMIEDGRCLNDDSSLSEKVLTEAMSEIIPFATKIFQQIGYKIVLEKSISLFECQTFFEKVGGPKPNPANNKVCMRPDGGILYAVSGGVKIPILIVEDKVQGTNDILHSQNKKRQATGNAIERGAKKHKRRRNAFRRTRYIPLCIVCVWMRLSSY